MNRHLSEDDISRWVSGERLAETERHLRECQQCAAELDETQKAFALFRESGRQWSDHWYRETPASAQPAGLRFAGAMAAGAATCVVMCAFLLFPVPARQKATADAEAPFLEMPYVAPLAPYERAEVVRMDVSVAELTAAGLDVRVPDTGATVLADVVLGQDGRAHAIRLVSNRTRSMTQ
jgi:hypothetical protein